jgi:glycosyltransferase involved in cell wall biosynthesis
MDLDDLNHCKYQLRSEYDPTLRLRLSSKVQAFQWKRRAYAALGHYDTVVVCSQQDKDYLGAANTQVVPNGFVRPTQKPQRSYLKSDILGFIGELRYQPNHAGLVWFRDNVWPLIRKDNPQVRLRIIGILPAEKDRVKADGFEYLGFVPDPAEEIDSWGAMVVPLTYGGGTRIKIIEAFTKMCPVVSTSIGAYGIQAQDGQHILLADSPEDFSADCMKLTQQPQLAKELAENGWQLFIEKYDWDVIGVSIREILGNQKNF